MHTDERTAVLAEVDRFVHLSVAPRVVRHEHALDRETLDHILEGAESLGLCGSDTSPTGLAPWEEFETERPCTDTFDILARIAKTNTAIAWVIHQRALARVVARAVGLGPSHAITIEGRWGIGGPSLARWLVGSTLDDDDRSHLGDLYAANAARVLLVAPTMRSLITLVFRDASMLWQRHVGDSLTVDRMTHAHGFDELDTATVFASSTAHDISDCTPDAFAKVAMAQMLGLVAIGLGTAEHAHDIARAFAAQRMQGGRPIDRHAAVLALLGQSRRTIDSVRAEATAMTSRPLDRASFGRVIAFRGEAHVRLTEAAHAAMQVMGGIGYMRETGLEKASRDLNVLRVMSGAPPELSLIAAEWERLHG
jgi:acyl-CoA dehydrogenase